MTSADPNCELMNVPAEEGKPFGHIYSSEREGTIPIYRCFDQAATTQVESGEQTISCSGGTSEPVDSEIGKFNLRLTPTGDAIASIGILDEGDIGVAERTVLAVRKRINTYAFVNPKDGMQYLVDVTIENNEDGTCKVGTGLLRADEECQLIPGDNLGTGERTEFPDLGLTCPDGYIKGLYINDFNAIEFNEHSNDYKVLCCSETIEF